jgi:hypothetical protein
VENENFVKSFFIAVALEGRLRDFDACLASSTLSADGKEVDNIGMMVSYNFKVELNVGNLGQSITACVPFKLIHPPEASEWDFALNLRA